MKFQPSSQGKSLCSCSPEKEEFIPGNIGSILISRLENEVFPSEEQAQQCCKVSPNSDILTYEDPFFLRWTTHGVFSHNPFSGRSVDFLKGFPYLELNVLPRDAFDT